MTYPPSEVWRTELATSLAPPPYVRVQSVSPREFVLIRYTSEPPAPKEPVTPVMMYPPSEVWRTELPTSLATPPYVRVQSVSPREFVLIRYTFEPPAPKEPVTPVMM